MLEPGIRDPTYKWAQQLKSEEWVRVIETFYKHNLDNRILNNLRQQLNEMIEDERGLVSVEIFRKMFFTFFKGEQFAYKIYELLLPLIVVCYDEVKDVVMEECSPNDARFKPIVRIQLLT